MSMRDIKGMRGTDLKVHGGKCSGIILSNRVFDKETGRVIPGDAIDYDYSDDEAESRRDPESCLQNWMAIGDEVTHVNNIILLRYKRYYRSYSFVLLHLYTIQIHSSLHVTVV